MYLDGLPSAVMLRNPLTGELETTYGDGIPVGYYDEDKSQFIVYNHLHMEIRYNESSDKKKNIVGFEV